MPCISVKGVVKTMYHCHTCFYLVGCQQRTFDIIKEMPPLDRFAHEFLQSCKPEAALTAMADVIFADLQEADWKAVLQTLALHKKNGAELILLTEKSNVETLFNSKEVSDIWITPMSDAEVRFRFLKWQQTWKSNKDFWLTRQYLETAINSVPNLIWYKTKDGIHVKVNDSFCAASGKTREQVEGRDHFFVWDVDPNDPETDGNSCMESERITMESEETCVTEETVKTGAGMRIFTTYKSPLYDVDGSVMGTVGMGIDVTQERTYQQELMKQTQKVETIFTSLDCGILRYTVNGRRLIDVNEAALELLGYESQEELEANTFDMIVSSIVDEDKEKVAEFLTRSETECGGSIGFCVRHKDGEMRTIMCDAEHSEENGELICQWFLLNFT